MIGIFDTGLGGLGIFKEIKKLLPKENIFYYADNENAPYGPRSITEIKRLTLKSLKYLEKQGCSLIVIACNTATVSGVDYFRKHMRLPIIGTVPVIKTAARETKNKKVALLATQNTVQSRYINKLIKKFATGIRVNKIACPGWVEAIENNNITDRILKKYLQKIQDEDIIILGCTHYPLIKKRIKELVKSKVKIIDSNAAVARQVKRVMELENLFQTHQKPKYIFQGSDKKQNLTIKVKKYL